MFNRIKINLDFIKGMAKLFEFMPCFNRNNFLQHMPMSDFHAFQADWAEVANDMDYAIKIFEEDYYERIKDQQLPNEEQFFPSNG